MNEASMFSVAAVMLKPLSILLFMRQLRRGIREFKGEIVMNNATIKRFDITIKLRGDNVYVLYFNDEWAASRGSYEGILNDAKQIIERSLLDG